MKKLVLILSILVGFSTSIFAANWECEKSDMQRYGEGINLSVICTDGVSTPISVTRPVFRPSKNSDIKNAIRNIAVEMKARQEADLKANLILANLKNQVIRAKDTDPDAI